MIAYLRGDLLDKKPSSIIVDVNGVGYGLTIPVSTYSELPAVGVEVEIQVHTHVREDALSLFGFLTDEEKDIFEKLITVSGVGPRLAVTVLSGLPVDRLVAAISEGDAKTLTRIPGVGRKTGERIILDLKDKIVRDPASEHTARSTTPGAAIERDVISAMVNLGCAQDAAEKAVDQARARGAELEFETLFRSAMDLVRR